MKKRRIFALGETVYDIIFKDDTPAGGCPGGSVLNTAVSLGKLNLPVYLVSEFGKDMAGEAINRFLNKNGVNTRFVYRYTNGRTPLALAFLDDGNNAKYDFYKILPADRLSIVIPDFSPDDILIFSSFFSLCKEIREKVRSIIMSAKQAGCLIVYDPNFRKPHIKDLPELIDFIHENISFSDIIRASDEDCSLIFNLNDPRMVWHNFIDDSKILVYTTTKSATLIKRDFAHTIEAKTISPVSTIGAGDSFNAGMVYSLIKNNLRREHLKELANPEAEKILRTGVDFASDVCMSMENYISDEFVKINLL